MPSPAVADDRIVKDFHSTDPADQVAALDRQTAAIQSLVSELTATRIAFTPAAEAVHSLGAAQAKFCDFIVNNRVKLLVGSVSALVGVGAISPNLANGIGIFLKAMGWQ